MVTTPATIERMLLVTAIVVPVRPKTLAAPPVATAFRTFSTMWYFVSRKPRRPRPFVTSSM